MWTYADVTVHDQADAEQAIEDGVGRAARGKRSHSEGDKAGGEKAFKCPVVGAVRLGGSRERSGVVHAAPVDGCSLCFNQPHSCNRLGLRTATGNVRVVGCAPGCVQFLVSILYTAQSAQDGVAFESGDVRRRDTPPARGVPWRAIGRSDLRARAEATFLLNAERATRAADMAGVVGGGEEAEGGVGEVVWR